MKLLYAASESVPFVKTGGLGDVVGSLAVALKKKFQDVRVILPRYRSIDLNDLEHIADITVGLSWRNQHCGIYTAKADGVTFYFLDNTYYFGRESTYGHFDDAERYAFFSKAVLEALLYIDFKPEVIHCHDWQAALIPVFYNAFYQHNERLSGIKTVMSIHNLQYQGSYSPQVFGDILALPDDFWGYMSFYDSINYLKGGIECCDYITTVSPTYANEIRTSEYGWGLEDVISYFSYKLRGILNGIDTNEFDPKKDELIYKSYTKASQVGKAENKRMMQEYCSLPVNPEVPLLAMVTRLTPQKGIELVLERLDDIMQRGVQFVIIGTGDARFEDALKKAQERYEGLKVFIAFDNSLAHKLYAAADIFLMPSLFEPCGLAQMIAMRYGTLPLVRETGGLIDTVVPFNKFSGEGNGFSFSGYSSLSMLEVLDIALSTYSYKETWKVIVKNAMSGDYGWSKAGLEYINLYKEIV